MEDQIRSTQQTGQNKAPNYAGTNSNLGSEMNKQYDQCDVKKGIVSIAMKAVPITVYLLFKLVSDQHLGLFVLTVLLISIDFWTTKNILGRKLVGLRWFTVIDDNNEQKWCFQSCKPNRVIAKINSVFFWIPQLLAIVFWLIIVIINIITLSLFWVALAIVACFLLVLNFAFFIECKGQHQQKVDAIKKKLGFNSQSDQGNQETQQQ